jgi:hypothetical protein
VFAYLNAGLAGTISNRLVKVTFVHLKGVMCAKDCSALGEAVYSCVTCRL